MLVFTTRSTSSFLDTQAGFGCRPSSLGQVSGSNGMDEIAEDSDIVEEARLHEPDRKITRNGAFYGKDQKIPLL